MHPDFVRRGIASKMTQLSYELMKKQGFLFSYAQCSGPYSEKALLNHGGKIEFIQEYATYEHNGKKPFEKIPAPFKHCSLVVTRF